MEVCIVHDRDTQAANGRRGGLAKAEREREARHTQAKALALETAADLRKTLTEVIHEAFADRQWGVCVSAVRAGVEVLKVSELEAEVRKLNGVVRELQERFGYGETDS